MIRPIWGERYFATYEEPVIPESPRSRATPWTLAKKSKACDEAENENAEAGSSRVVVDDDDEEPESPSRDAAARSQRPASRPASHSGNDDNSEPEVTSTPPRKRQRTNRLSSPDRESYVASSLMTPQSSNPDAEAIPNRNEAPTGSRLENAIVLDDDPHPLISAILDELRSVGIILKGHVRMMIEHEISSVMEAHNLEVRQHRERATILKREQRLPIRKLRR